MTAHRPEVKSRRSPPPHRSAKPEAPVQRPARPADRKGASPRHPAATCAEKSPGIPRVSGSIGFPDRTDRPIFAIADRSPGHARARRSGSSGPRLPDSRAFLRVLGSIGFRGRTGRPIFATADRSRGSCARGRLRRSGSSGPRLPDSRAFLRASGSSGFCGDGTFACAKDAIDRSSGRTPCADHGAFPPEMLKEIGGRPAAKSIV